MNKKKKERDYQHIHLNYNYEQILTLISRKIIYCISNPSISSFFFHII